MDIRSISCFWLFLVLFTIHFRAKKVACQAVTQAPGQKGNSSAVTQAPGQKGNSSAVTQAPGQKGNSSAVTQAPGQKGNSSGVTQAPGQKGVTQAPGQKGVTQAPGQKGVTQAPGQQGGTQAPGTTTPAPIQCVKGNCTGKGDDESCLKNIQPKCKVGSTGSCTKDVTKNATHTFVKVGCGNAACPTKPTTTTAKPSSPAPETTISTCCEKHLCNQYQTKSAAFKIRTNMLYVIGILILIVCT